MHISSSSTAVLAIGSSEADRMRPCIFQMLAKIEFSSRLKKASKNYLRFVLLAFEKF
jgi:hypothetical protein